jgi:hypothetical protein
METVKAFTAAQPGWKAVYYDRENGSFFTNVLIGWAAGVDYENVACIVPLIWETDGRCLYDPTDDINFCSVLSPDEELPAVDSEQGRRWVENTESRLEAARIRVAQIARDMK